MDLALAEDYQETSSEPNFFENYKSKKKKVDTLLEEWEQVEEEVAAFS